jgi:tellurite resistance protein TerC
MRALLASKKTFRRAAVIVVGSTVVLFGILLIVLPGPAFIVIPAGLAILGLEFAWARRWMRILQERARGTVERFSFKRQPIPTELARDSWRTY